MIEHFVSVAQKRLPLGPELQIALNLIPAHTWYAVPLGALTFVNERAADYLGLPKDHRLVHATSVEVRADRPLEVVDERVYLLVLKRHAEFGRTVYAPAAPVR